MEDWVLVEKRMQRMMNVIGMIREAMNPNSFMLLYLILSLDGFQGC